MSAPARKPHPPGYVPTSQLVAYARWIAADPARGDLPHAEAWRLFSGGAPAPTLPRLPIFPTPPPPPVRAVPKPAPAPAKVRSPRVPRVPRVPAMRLRMVPERAAPIVSRYEQGGRFLEVFAFTDPEEYVLRCPHQTHRAVTFAAALDRSEAWRCGFCHLTESIS